jgi:type I restriction enzyme S subunit
VNKVIVKTHQKITKEGASKSQLVEIGDFILSNSMSFGKPVIMGIEGYIHDGWFLIKLFKAIDVDYFYNLLTSLFVQNQFLESASGAVVKNIRADIVKKTMLPIPPFEEQKEIVKKVENLFAICDQLEEQITSSQTNAEQLMQSVLKEAFSQDEKAA